MLVLLDAFYHGTMIQWLKRHWIQMAMNCRELILQVEDHISRRMTVVISIGGSNVMGHLIHYYYY